MSQFEEKLSAYLDGELSFAESAEIEAALQTDTDLQAELEALMAADTLAKGAFAEALNDPIPTSLASAIYDASDATAANAQVAPTGYSGLFAAALACLMLVVGGVGGYMVSSSQQPTQVAAAPGWLVDIADYHGVYAKENRHLVEVGADESNHIMTWLTNSVGANVRIPDLAASGLTFEGARLLVAAGKPVAQLMYTDADGGVVALCLIATDTPREGIGSQTIGAFEMVSWGGDDANYVIVGDEGRDDLEAIALSAGEQV